MVGPSPYDAILTQIVELPVDLHDAVTVRTGVDNGE